MRRVLSILGVLAIVASACAGSGHPPPDDVPAPALEGVDAGMLPSGPSALQNPRDEALPPTLIDPDQLIVAQSPDGIPSIDDPHFVPVAEADSWLADEEAVVHIVLGGEARAYPVQILMFHEIVNDVVDGVPVAITYCPLCNSAVTHRREINGVETTFGTSGRLFASALVMYDRSTETLWTHFDGRAVAGVLTGHELEAVPSPLLSWGDFKEDFPDGAVLDKFRTGERFRYGDNPYVGYDVPGSFPVLYVGDAIDPRAAPMQRVVGVAVDGAASAWTLDAIQGSGPTVTSGRVGDSPVVVFWAPGQVSALQTFHTFGGRDVGSAGVFVPRVGDTILEFEVANGRILDGTGSEWTVTGRALDGPMAGTVLERLHHLDTFWFAWSSYHPDTELIERNRE